MSLLRVKLLLVLAGLASAGLGYAAFRRYLATERYLAGVRADLARQGATATVDGCVDALLAWRPTCTAPRVLCDSFAARAMGACLAAQDRRAACAALPRNLTTTHYARAECRRRGTTRRTDKTCATAYRMLDAHCRGLRKDGER